MFRSFLLVLGSLGFGLLFVFLAAIRRPLAYLLRALIAGVAAILGVAGAAITVAGLTNEAWWAVVIGAGFLLGALRLGWSLRRPRQRLLKQGQSDHVPLTSGAGVPHWSSFEANLDWVGRQQARRARTAIDRFVAERDSESLSVEHRSLLLSCEKRVPELLAVCIERCRNASPQERERYIDDTLEKLVQIGGEAERARREVREADDRRLAVLHRYFDGITGEGDDTRDRS